MGANDGGLRAESDDVRAAVRLVASRRRALIVMFWFGVRQCLQRVGRAIIPCDKIMSECLVPFCPLTMEAQPKGFVTFLSAIVDRLDKSTMREVSEKRGGETRDFE